VAQPVIVDTDVLIDFLRGRGPSVDLVEQLIRDGAFVTTVITFFELVQGSEYPDEHARISPLLREQTLPLTAAAAARAGVLSRDLRARGQMIATADLLQAGLCIEHDLPLATKNVRHFERIPGLEILSPI
jgi:tRNA(fMet)-specific endonuclease VapC